MNEELSKETGLPIEELNSLLLLEDKTNYLPIPIKIMIAKYIFNIMYTELTKWNNKIKSTKKDEDEVAV